MKAKSRRQSQPRTRSQEQCETPECTEPAVCCGKCAPCYNYEWRWARRTPAARRVRRQQVAKYQARLDAITIPHVRRVK